MHQAPIVYWPGASGNGAIYEPLLAAMPVQPASIVVDYPGLGATAARPDVASLSDLFAHVVERLPLRCDLVALSMGSTLALRAALEFPERIRKLVLIAPTGGFDARRLGAADWRPGWVTRRPTAPRWIVDDTSDFTERLAEIAAPTLLVFGDADPLAPLDVAHRLVAGLRQPTLEVVAGATHDIVEQHAPELSRLVARYLLAAP